MHIIKCWNRIPQKWELYDYAQNLGLSISDLIGKRMSVNYKDGKKRRLKKFTLLGYRVSPCETCGSHTYATFRVGGEVIEREW